MDLIKNLISRLDFSATMLTVAEFLLIVAIYPLMRYAAPQWFTENGIVENVQLLILSVAFVIALKSTQNRQMYVFFAMIIILLMMRETNMGRGYFCAKYLTPDEVCKWNHLKYGYIAGWIRGIYVLGVICYALYIKVWRPIIKYIVKAPIFVWELLFMAIGVICATMAEMPRFDNEILEECAEMLVYVTLCNLLWRYSRCRIASSS